MLYVRKDLASKYIDWRGVGRGGQKETLQMSRAPKITRFVRDLGSGLPLRSRPLNAST